MDKATAFLSLGSNLGNKEQNMLRAIGEIEKRIGIVKAQSAFLVTEPWGFESENTFLNAAVKVETTLSPLEMLHSTQLIEQQMGRTQKSHDGAYHDRIIDIDILQYFPAENYEKGDETIDEDGLHFSSQELTIPHPLMKERDFVLIPLSEIK